MRASFQPTPRLEFYAEVFEDAGALDLLEGFASLNGADFYGLPRNQETSPGSRGMDRSMTYPFGDHEVVPLRAGGTIRWRVAEQENPG